MNQYKYKYVIDRIKQDIKRGEIVDKLPGERTIAKRLDISYMTVRKAVEMLCDEGILYKLPTKGTYVNKSGNSRIKTSNIGFYLDDRIKEGISSPYYSLVFKALDKEALKHNYNLIYFSEFEDICPADHCKKIDGLIVACFPRLENRLYELKRLLPIVVIGNSASDKSIPSVIIDNFNGTVAAIDFLVSLGHSRIGYIAGMLDSNVGKDRKKGYESAIENHGWKIDKELIYKGDYSYLAGMKGGNYLLSLPIPPTAIVCANDSMAIGALAAVRDKGFGVPEDMSIIGFDDITVASQIHPPLTTIAAPITKIAKNSVNLLLSLIQERDLSARHIALPAHLVTRYSCAENKLASLRLSALSAFSARTA